MWTQTLILALLIVGGFHHNRRALRKMSQALTQQIADLVAEVSEIKGEEDSAIKLIDSIPDIVSNAIAAATDDSAAVAAVKDVVAQLKAKGSELAAAVVANSPAAPAPAAPPVDPDLVPPTS